MVVALVLLFVGFGLHNKSWIPTPDQMSYRLVPEKVSRSAAITVSIPEASGNLAATLDEHVIFNPTINGRWLEDKRVSLVGVAHSAEKIRTYYYQPNSPLEENKHYEVTVSSPDNQSISADFLVVADPEIISILPAEDEVLTNTKISIVFNRPMVPLSTLDAMSPQSLPITITPATPGKFKWISTHTLQFIPTKDLISSAEYTVSVGEGLKSMEGLPVKPKKSTFSTYHIRFAADGVNKDYDPTQNVIRGYNQPFLIAFNQAVDRCYGKKHKGIYTREKRAIFRKLLEDKKSWHEN